MGRGRRDDGRTFVYVHHHSRPLDSPERKYLSQCALSTATRLPVACLGHSRSAHPVQREGDLHEPADGAVGAHGLLSLHASVCTESHGDAWPIVSCRVRPNRDRDPSNGTASRTTTASAFAVQRNFLSSSTYLEASTAFSVVVDHATVGDETTKSTLAPNGPVVVDARDVFTHSALHQSLAAYARRRDATGRDELR